ncbi:hypothetical protein KKD52_11880 [Myxococcota bacterium]|nr:hypothetical protein [Myxococcota bacterium]MBU1511053.1 hypothetical protein [Myxococcota bacterium]
MHKLEELTSDDFVDIGRNVGSDPIHRESQDAIGQWERDIDELEKYGFTREELAQFKEQFRVHHDLMIRRSESVARKKGAVEQRDQIIHTAWTWVEQVLSIVGRRVAGNPGLVQRFNEVYPANDAGLWRAIEPIATLLREHQGAFPEAVPVQALLDEAPQLRERMSEIFGKTDLVKAEPIQDTREIDELDGRLYVTIRELNAAGRRAIRAGRLTRQPPYYRFNHLRKAPRPTPTPSEG